MNEGRGTGGAAPSSRGAMLGWARSRWSQCDGVLWGLVLLAVLIRTPGLNRPLLGNFATRHTAHGMIARNWALGRAPLQRPTLDVLIGGQPGLNLTEVPVAAYAAGALWRVFGGSLDTASLDFWGRTVSIACSAGAVAWLFVFVRRRYGVEAGAAAGAMFALSPASVIYGQGFMLEPSVALLAIGSMDAAERFAQASANPGRRGTPLSTAGLAWLLLAGLCLGLMALTKIYMLILAPVMLWTVWRDAGEQRGRKLILACLAGVLAVAPAVAWCGYVWHISRPESPWEPHIFFSLRDSGATHAAPWRLLLTPDFYRRMLDDLAGVALTPVGLTLLVLGLCRRETWRLAPWLAAMVVLVAVMPRKFYEMHYYALVVLPPLAVTVGLGWRSIAEGLGPARRWAAGALFTVGLVYALRYSAKPAWSTPIEDQGVLPAAAAVQALSPPELPVATLHGTTFDLLYYCDRRGVLIPPSADRLPAALDEARRLGARYLAVAHLDGLPREVRDQLNALPQAAQGPGFAVYRLTPEP